MNDKIYIYPENKEKQTFCITIKECGGIRVVRLFSSKPTQEFLDSDNANFASTDNVKTTILENVALDHFDDLELN